MNFNIESVKVTSYPIKGRKPEYFEVKQCLIDLEDDSATLAIDAGKPEKEFMLEIKLNGLSIYCKRFTANMELDELQSNSELMIKGEDRKHYIKIAFSEV